jgi:hypothetical protein
LPQEGDWCPSEHGAHEHSDCSCSEKANCHTPPSGEEEGDYRKREQIPTAVDPRRSRNQCSSHGERRPGQALGVEAGPHEAQRRHDAHGQDQWPAEGEARDHLRFENGQSHDGDEPALDAAQQQEWPKRENEEQRRHLELNERGRVRAGHPVDEGKQCMPAGAEVDNARSMQEDLIPVATRDGLGRVPERVVLREKSFSENPKADESEDCDRNSSQGARVRVFFQLHTL